VENPPYSSGIDSSNVPIGEGGDHVLGDVVVVTVDVLGDRPHLVLCEAAERVAHHLEVGVEMARTRYAGQRGEELGGAMCTDEAHHRVERAGLDPPRRFAAEQA
jgi:hypothetical protein